MTTTTINTTGSITVAVADGDSLLVTSAGTITSHATQVYAVVGTGSIGTLTNSGLLRLGGGVNVTTNAGDIANTGGTIGGTSNYAIQVGGTLGILTNTGVITGNGIDVVSGDLGTMDNETDGVIDTVYRAVSVDSGTIDALTNAGSMIGTDDGIFGNNISEITNTGTITGGATHVGIGIGNNAGTLTNSGLISAGGGLNAGGTITDIDNLGGTITGTAATDISVSGDLGTLNNAAGGGIEGNHTGIDVGGTIGVLTNAGIISGGTHYAAVIANEIDTLTNAGTITGGSTGVYIGSSLGTLTNFGLIEGTKATGINDGGGGDIDNTGTIGGVAGADTAGIIMAAPGTIENAGTILGGIQFDGSGSSLILDPGFAVTGTVTDGPGDGTLELAGTGAITVGGIAGSASDTGAQFVGFGTIVFANPEATIAGSVDGLASGQTIAGFAAGDTLVLDGVAATAAQYDGTSTIELGQSGSSDQIDIGPVTGADLVVSSDGTNTTIAAVAPAVTIGTSGNILVYLASGDGLSITSSGTIDNSVTAAVEAPGAMGTLTNSGWISADIAAVAVLGNAADIENLGGTITAGGVAAVYVGGTIGALTNDGTITNTNGDGIFAAAITMITNDGTIDGTAAIQVSGGIGGINNVAGATMAGGAYGVHANLAIGTLTNAGTISGGTSAGVYAATITTLTNSGLIQGGSSSDGIDDGGGGYIDNTGSIEGGNAGIIMQGSGTVENAGVIVGGIQLQGSASTLILDPGSDISGNVIDDQNDGTLILGGSDPLAVNGIDALNGSDQYQGFSTITFDNADATAKGTVGGLASGQAITGFVRGDTIILDGVADNSGTYNNGVLTLSDGTTALDIGGSFTTSTFAITTDGTNTTINVVCYYPGTGIRTPGGDVAVEALAVGDAVVIADGRVMPVRWIGRNTVSTRFADPLRVLPIRIRAGALDEGLPERDLLVSPEHALLVDDILIQAGALVNGVSIIRERDVPETFTYHHVELAEHTLILAEGAAAESFVDNIHRSAFDNWDDHEALYGTAPIAEMPYPRAQSHRQVPTEIHARLATRAQHLLGRSDTKAA